MTPQHEGLSHVEEKRTEEEGRRQLNRRAPATLKHPSQNYNLIIISLALAGQLLFPHQLLSYVKQCSE